MIADILYILASIVVLFAGAEGLVRGSASMAIRLGLTPLVAGLTVVAFGTSAPELVVSIKAALEGQGDIAVGNVVGSNIFNVGIILGLSALICPLPVKWTLIRIDAPIMVAVSLLVPLAFRSGTCSPAVCAAFVAGLLAYVVMTVLMARRNTSTNIREEFDEGVPHVSKSGLWDIGLIIGGLGLLIVGANLLVRNAVALATDLGVSEAVIGLTIVAAGTSVPELATSIVAAVRKQPDIAVGNVVGSNIFNILGILGISGLIHPLTVTNIRALDHLAMIAFAIALVPMLWSGRLLKRLEGAILVAGYAAYLVALWPA